MRSNSFVLSKGEDVAFLKLTTSVADGTAMAAVNTELNDKLK